MYENISDPDMFAVYSRGLTGKIKGLIFGHFQPIDELPQEEPGDRILWGIDYGYTTDPTALVKIIKRGRKRFAKEITYTAGLSAEAIVKAMTDNGFNWDFDSEREVVYSEADPDMINQLRALGLPVQPAIKGPGSVKAGIAKVRQHECYCTHDSQNFWHEIKVYKFLTDEDMVTGKEVMINKPIETWDHCCDAFRYADYTDDFRYPE
jgi:phage terminase large subunit